MTLDTEESERLELTMEQLAAVCREPSLAGWNGFGIAVQTYQKRALPMLKSIVGLAKETKRILHVRLVKGAYWDAEIKRGQERGLPGYPLYTRKPNTDVSYLACARYVFDQGKDVLYPQFASHNAHTVAAVASMAKKAGFEFEFQRLHGMGEELYTHVTDPSGLGIPCRVYAPVGEHEDLLPYLVRRLLENGSNTSFVNRIVNENEPIDAIIADPVRTVDGLEQVAHPRIPQPLEHLPAGAQELAGRAYSRTARCARRWRTAWNTCRVVPGWQRPWSVATSRAGRSTPSAIPRTTPTSSAAWRTRRRTMCGRRSTLR